MKITLIVGNVGSGKTALMGYMMMRSPFNVYTNVAIKADNVRHFDTDDMFVMREIIHKDGYVERYPIKVNEEFWKTIDTPADIFMDEIQDLADARTPSSRWNRTYNTWLAQMRKYVTQEKTHIPGEVYFATQLSRNADIRMREMANRVIYCICYWIWVCKDCDGYWKDSSESPEAPRQCPRCGSINLRQDRHRLEVRKFNSVALFDAWSMRHDDRLCYQHKFINDISSVFTHYDSLQKVKYS